MKPLLHPRLLNGYFEDPCLFVRILYEKRAILFDLGTMHSLKPSELNKITDVFVTHTHMDHFIGFDTLLRAVLRREVPLNIYGPPSILPCVQGKLRGYTWNLIEDYPAVINVFAYNGRYLTHSVFPAKNRFKKQDVSRTESDGLLLQDPMFTVRAAKLDHSIPCLAYCLEEKYHINIDKALLAVKGLPVGPWLNEFKKLIREHPYYDRQKVRVEGRQFRVADLSGIARITKGQKISYATDIAINSKNIAALINLVKGSDLFFCEAYFLEKDRERALERSHLTARTTGSIARLAGVKKLEPLHFSPKYSDCPEKVIYEAMREFQG